jgi:hypothetical protein
MRKLGRYLVVVLVTLVALYVSDCAIFQLRLPRGTGLSSVSVEQYLRMSLKGQKSEFYFQGTKPENCSRTMFPQWVDSQWTPPCWWLERHPQHWQEAAL